MVDKVSIAISRKHATAVRRAVESGAYPSADAVMDEALDLWRQSRLIDDEELGRLWDEGIASGIAGPWDKDEFLRKARKRKSNERKRSRTTNGR